MTVDLKNLTLPFLLALLCVTCRKASFTDDPEAQPKLGIDTLQFDTVFVTAGSITRSFKIFNGNDKGIRLSSVRLAGGSASPFRINVGGTPGPEVEDIEIAANDSTYIFATVTVDPGGANLPFLVRDSIEVKTNGRSQFVQLQAYGKNARFLRNRKITGTETWNDDLPYVILGSLTVEASGSLLIDRGCRIFIHADAPFIVNGTLEVKGEQWDSTRVVFSGDRLDPPYNNYPASYPGLIFTKTSRNNSIRYATIKNAYQGIVVAEPAVTTAPKLVVYQTIIDNAYDAGLLGINSSIRAENLLISNCGKNLALVGGGDYAFSHCTVETVSNPFVEHKEPVLYVSNAADNTTPPMQLTALFRNCIFWGEKNGLVTDEVVVSKTGGTPYNVLFEGVLWRVQNSPAAATTAGSVINNQSPLFDSINAARNFYSFRLKEGSPAMDKGSASSVPIDLDGAARPVRLPDLGAYEKQ